MASRSGGRSDERSGARGATGSARASTSGGSTGSAGRSSSGGSTARRSSGTSPTAGADRQTASSSGGTSASRPAGGSTAGAAGTRQSGRSAGSATSSGQSAPIGQTSSQNQGRESQGQSRESQSTPGAGTGVSAGASMSGSTGSGTSSHAGAGLGAARTSSRTDQERELRTSREQGNMRPGASAQRAGVGGSQRNYAAPLLTSAMGSSSPFAMMRRMMDDMDRLFSDFGFTHPGMLASSLLNPEHWTAGHSPSRAIGGGAAGGSSAPAARRQQGVQRGGQQGLSPLPPGGLWAPQVEVFERGDNLVIRADLPGLTREDVDVEVDEDALIIRGERHSDVEDEQEGFYRSERSYGSFYRAIPLPDNVDASSCNATFRDGVLEVTLPKPPQQQSRARRIDVK